MPKRRGLTMRQIRLMLRLAQQGVSAREIGRTLGVARSTVQDGLERARAADSGADHVIDGARVFATLDEAIADLSFVIATTRRDRDMTKRVEGPAEGLAELCAVAATGAGTGILFGRERWGLDNEEVARATIIVTFPTDPTFASLNIAQSVLLMAYEWRRVAHGPQGVEPPENPPASREEVEALWRHLASLLQPTGYFRPAHMAEKMERNLLLILSDAGWDRQQVRTLRGVLAHLERGRVPSAEEEGGRT